MEEIRDANSTIFHKLLESNLKKAGLDVKIGVRIYYHMFRFIKHQLIEITGKYNLMEKRIKVIIPYFINLYTKKKKNKRYMTTYNYNLKIKNNE